MDCLAFRAFNGDRREQQLLVADVEAAFQFEGFAGNCLVLQRGEEIFRPDQMQTAREEIVEQTPAAFAGLGQGCNFVDEQFPTFAADVDGEDFGGSRLGVFWSNEDATDMDLRGLPKPRGAAATLSIGERKREDAQDEKNGDPKTEEQRGRERALKGRLAGWSKAKCRGHDGHDAFSPIRGIQRADSRRDTMDRCSVQ